MRPYGERQGDDRGVSRRQYTPGGSYDISVIEKVRIKRRPKKRARQEGKKDTEIQS